MFKIYETHLFDFWIPLRFIKANNYTKLPLDGYYSYKLVISGTVCSFVGPLSTDPKTTAASETINYTYLYLV